MKTAALEKHASRCKALHFRCVKFVHEEKRTNSYSEPDTIKQEHVEVTFDCVEAEKRSAEGQPHTHFFHGYLSIHLSPELHRELGYEVGKIYELAPT